MRRLVIALSVMVLVFAGVSIAGATSVDFLIGDDNSIVTPEDLTITADLSHLPGIKFNLNKGESFIFDYATNVDVTADAETYDITANLEFILPDGVGVVGSDGLVSVNVIKIMGNGGCGGCTPDTVFTIGFNPETVQFGNGGEFILALSEVDVPWDTGCKCYTASGKLITATVTLETIPVPEPSTLWQLGAGLLCLSAYRIRRRR